LLVNGCIVNRNIAPLRFTMRLFTGNLQNKKATRNRVAFSYFSSVNFFISASSSF